MNGSGTIGDGVGGDFRSRERMMLAHTIARSLPVALAIALQWSLFAQDGAGRAVRAVFSCSLETSTAQATCPEAQLVEGGS